MSRKRARNGEPVEEEDKKSDHVFSFDRISKLPDSVIHHILSFVPTIDVVRTSILSKRWRLMWIHVPALRISTTGYRAGFKVQEEAFNSFVESYLKYRKKSLRFVPTAVTTFQLEAYGSPKLSCSRLSQWFGSPFIMNKLEDLDLSFNPEEEYTLPPAVLNGRSLTRLRLYGNMRIDDSCLANLPSLKSLSLMGIQIDNTALNNLLIWCPSLEKFEMRYLFEPRVFLIRIPNLNLRFVRIMAYIEWAYIECSSIQTLRLYNNDSPDTKFDFSTCQAIRDLTLCGIHNSRVGKFESQISKLPHLQSLRVYLPTGKVNISNRSLEQLYIYKYDLKEGESENKVAIDARSLVSLCFEGNMDINMSMGLLNHHAKGKFSVKGPTSELIKFLSSMNRCWSSLDISIDFIDKEETKGGFELPENLKEISLPPWHHLKHLKVKLSRECAQRSDFEDFLKRLAPSLETVSIEYGV